MEDDQLTLFVFQQTYYIKKRSHTNCTLQTSSTPTHPSSSYSILAADCLGSWVKVMEKRLLVYLFVIIPFKLCAIFGGNTLRHICSSSTTTTSSIINMSHLSCNEVFSFVLKIQNKTKPKKKKHLS